MIAKKILYKGHRPFLKWPGGKYRLCTTITKKLPQGKVFVEPFVGAGAIFLNVEYDKYILNDINADLITLYRLLQSKKEDFIKDAKQLFIPKNNLKVAYYALRAEFNSSTVSYERALLFLYLNRHGYNGLCRYNRSGGYNVPFGSYVKPYFPQQELEYFCEKSQKATFNCVDYKKIFQQLKQPAVIYCDPPYVPLTTSAMFTNYAGNNFTLSDHQELAFLAEQARDDGHSVIISNHNTQFTRALYSKAKINKFDVGRNISCNTQTRNKVSELLAIYKQ